MSPSMRTPLLSIIFTGLISISLSVVVAYVLLAAVILVIVAGGVRYTHQFVDRNLIVTGEMRRDSLIVERAGTHEIVAEIVIGFSEIIVSPATPEDVDAGDIVFAMDYETNVVDLRPHAQYAVTDGLGSLDVAPSIDIGIPNLRRYESYHNRWDVHLPASIPISLTSSVGTGSGTYTLSGMDLTGLEINVGTGELLVDLRGSWPRSFSAELNSGTGEITVLLPEEAGVRVQANRAIGNVDVAGLQRLEIDDESYWVNAAYGHEDVTLDIEANVGVGNLRLIVLSLGAEIPAG